MNFKPVRESCSFLFLVAATQQVRRKPRFRLATRPPTRTEALTHAPRAPRAHHAPRFPTGLASANRPSRTRNLIARRLTPLRLRYGTLDLAGPKHTPCLRRDARMVATSPPARVVTCVPLPLEFPPTAIARATEPEPLGFLDRRAGLRGDRAGPSATRLDARSGYRAHLVPWHVSDCRARACAAARRRIRPPRALSGGARNRTWFRVAIWARLGTRMFSGAALPAALPAACPLRLSFGLRGDGIATAECL